MGFRRQTPMALSLVASPDAEPFDWETAQKQIRQDGIDDDQDFVERVLIPAVRERGQGATRRQFITAGYVLKLDAFPGCGQPSPFFGFERGIGAYIEIPKPPLQEVTAIQYLDLNGQLRTWDPSAYVVDAPAGSKCRRGRIALAYGSLWPQTLPQMNAVTIAFNAGYGDDGEDVPPLLIEGMLLDLSALYENRTDIVIDQHITTSVELPNGSASIYRSFKSYSRMRA